MAWFRPKGEKNETVIRAGRNVIGSPAEVVRKELVDGARIELATSALRTRRSPS